MSLGSLPEAGGALRERCRLPAELPDAAGAALRWLRDMDPNMVAAYVQAPKQYFT